MTAVRKAVLPVAGLGTRVLPGTKTTPKELLNVVDRPILSYIVQEAREAGIEHIVFVTGRSKGAIEDYFDHQVELEAQLEAKGKTDVLEAVRRDLPKAGEMSFTRQMAPLGLGHAVWCARDIIGNEPFAVLLPDVIVDARPGALGQLMRAYDLVGGNIIGVEEVPASETHKYGIIDPERTEGRMSAYILTAVPALLFAGIMVLMPKFYSEVWGEPMTWYLLGGSISWLMLGNLMMFKMANFKF